MGKNGIGYQLARGIAFGVALILSMIAFVMVLGQAA